MRIVKLVAGAALLALSGMAIAGPVNVNTADAETISAELKGIGLAIAAALFLEWWARQREITEFAQPEMPESEVPATSEST